MIEFSTAKQNQITLAGEDGKYLEKLSDTFPDSYFRSVRIKLKEIVWNDSKAEFIEFLNKNKPKFDINKLELKNDPDIYKTLYTYENRVSYFPDKIYKLSYNALITLINANDKGFDIEKLLNTFDFEHETNFDRIKTILSLSFEKDIEIEKIKHFDIDVLQLFQALEKKDIEFLINEKSLLEKKDLYPLIPFFINNNLDLDVLKSYKLDMIIFASNMVHIVDMSGVEILKDVFSKIYKEDIPPFLLNAVLDSLDAPMINKNLELLENLDKVIEFNKTHTEEQTKLFVEYILDTSLEIENFEENVSKYGMDRLVMYSNAIDYEFENPEYFLNSKLDFMDLVEVFSTCETLDIDLTTLLNENHTFEQYETILKLVKKGFSKFDTDYNLSPDDMYAKCYLDKWNIKVPDKNYYETYIKTQHRDIEALLRLGDTIPHLIDNNKHIIIEQLYKRGEKDILGEMDNKSPMDFLNNDFER